MAEINSERLIKMFKTLAETESPSLDERRVCDALKAELKGIASELREDGTAAEIGGTSGNVYAYFDGDSALSPLLFSAHMDTVGPCANKKVITEDSGLIHSDGTTILGSDDLAGVCAITEALKTVYEKKIPHRPIEVIFSVCEEKYCGGAAYFDYGSVKSKEAYVFDLDGEPGAAAYAAPTILSFSAKFIGRASHAGLDPESGINALKAACLAVTEIKCGKNSNGTTVNIGTIHGGAADNIVPDCCSLTGEVRSYSDEEAEKQYLLISDIIKKAAAEFGAKAELDFSRGVVAYETPLDSPVAGRFEKACENLGIKPEFVRSFGGSDNNVFAQNGIAGLVLSTAMNDCHTTKEWTTVQGLEKAALLALELMTSKE